MKQSTWNIIIAVLIGLLVGLLVDMAIHSTVHAAARETLIESEPVEQVETLTTCAADVALEEQIDERTVELLALVIYQEAGGDCCSDETRRMVGEVVLNRVASSRYPNTITEVLLQRAQYGRLHWTGLVWPERASSAGEAHAVARAYDCAAQVLTGDRLLPTDVIYQAEFPQGTETLAHVDGFYFCR